MGTTAPGSTGIWRPMRDRPFAVYWLGGFLSNVGTWIQVVATSVFIYQLTGSAFSIGLLNFWAFLPILLFSVPGGVVADRFDRRAIVTVASAVAGLVAAGLAALTLAGRSTDVHVMVAAFAINTSYAFAKPALSSLLPALVDRSDISEAVSLNALQFVTGELVGPLLASLILAVAGAGWAFAINAITFVGPIAAMVYLSRCGIGGRPSVTDDLPREPAGWIVPGTTSPPPTHPPVFQRSQRWVASALLGVVCTCAAAEVVRTLAPVLAASLHLPVTDAGLIIAAQSTGSAIGLVAFVRLRQRYVGLRIAWAGLALQGIAAVGTSVSGSLPITALAVAGNGIGLALCFPVLTGMIQAEVPDAMRGRVMSLHTLAQLGNRPFISIAAGSIAAVAGAPVAVLLGVALAPVGIFAVRDAWQRIRPGKPARLVSTIA